MKTRVISVLAFVTAVIAATAMQGQAPQPRTEWFAAGSGLLLPREPRFENSSGRLGLLNAAETRAAKIREILEGLGIPKASVEPESHVIREE
jgi:hypothetical protein